MDIIEQLEKLNALKEKGALSEYEYDYQKQMLLEQMCNQQNNNYPANTNEQLNYDNFIKSTSSFIVVILIIIGGIFYGLNSLTGIECNKTTMTEAEKLVQQMMDGLGEKTIVHFRNPQTVEEKSDYKKCKVDTNMFDIPIMHYEVYKKEGEVMVSINPLKDAAEYFKKQTGLSLEQLMLIQGLSER